jgi:hypothetical protein
MDERYISTKRMLQEVISKLGLREVHNLPMYDIISWMGQALTFIGGYTALETVKKKVKVVNYTGTYPQDLYAIIRVSGHPRFTSKRNGFVIDLQDGEVEVEYDKFPTDEDGFPVFPNEPSTKEAITWYIAKYLSIQDKLPNKKLGPDYCDSQWQWYCGQARAEGFTPTIDQWERMVNNFYRLIPLNNEYANEFTGLNSREILSRDKPNELSIYENG